jgi:energy-coupling factor transporter ATP-binding protein EcfA2
LSSFAAYSEAAETLLTSMPAIHAAVHGDEAIDELPGWRSMRMRFQAFRDQGGEPVQVAMLFGPSGAGKSTVFRQLTGIHVPAGGDIRPMTYGCAVAAPSSLATAERLGRLFPFYQLDSLASPEQLGRRDQPEDLLYFAASDRVPTTGELPLVLVDVPDFTTFCTENWAKAERMLERAEIVIFVVFDEAYSDNRVIENLALACRKASFLAYVFTKTTRAAAEKKWQHLLAVIQESQSAPRFAEPRGNGQTVRDFLAAAPVYHSIRSETPRLADIQPVFASGPPFDSLLVGQDGEKIILTGLLESTSQATASCQDLLARAARLAGELQTRLDLVRNQVARAASEIAQGEFPMLRLLAIAVEESQAIEQGWLRALKAPLRWLVRSASTVYSTAKSVIRSFSQQPADDKSVRTLADLEQEALEQHSERLATTWRLEFPLEATVEGTLSAARCTAARAALLAAVVPDPTTHWESVVREAVRNWCQQHRASAMALSACGDMFAVAAGGIVVLDLVHTGGIGLGSASMLAGAPAAVAAAAKLIELLNLRGVAERALAEWQKQRQAELARHLQTQFADPLFRPWIERLAALDMTKIAMCQSACHTVERLLSDNRS